MTLICSDTSKRMQEHLRFLILCEGTDQGFQRDARVYQIPVAYRLALEGSSFTSELNENANLLPPAVSILNGEVKIHRLSL
ncbi:hypothetical protein QQF64_010944 [Cirrhinus molitorella]|uniref:Uncharacterized protein n=1 Tax=Cirrhinus molitorella TaxID=172907 RepID=A0ABR3LYR4_9TELE